ncbi:MAG: hypothetical protein JW882_01150 [Deltaproteobacteria bacterium]|nr:hypothetical protein [Deltaproteobacteria bacterium]
MSSAREEQIKKEIERLRLLLKDREDALPAHSIRPHQILMIEELEEEITAREKELLEYLQKTKNDEQSYDE